MCFGLKHAQLTFYKTLRPVIKLIREELGVRIVAYCDDIIIIHEEREKLDSISQSIINILTNFGWKISIKKSKLQPTQYITFLGWEINVQKDQLMMTIERQNKIRQIIARWRRVVQKGTHVKVKYLASFIGSLNFLLLQIRRGRLHMRKLNKVKAQIAQQMGWNSELFLNYIIIQEFFLWKAEVDKNKPIYATIVQPQAILSTDASMNSWGAFLKQLNPEEQIPFQGDWDPFLKAGQVQPLKIETDNSSAAFNINPGAAATELAKLVDRTLETAEKLNIQLHAFHIPGLQNKVPDSLSRLATSGDYMIDQEILDEALHILKIRPTINMFANRKNRRCKRFMSLIPDNWAVAQD
ncbi:MAG: hypothetical protein EZS28_026536, partial [Streblomastix strix]